MSLRISSPAFEDQSPIPERYTCDGLDASPPLEWSGAPSGTRTFALIVDDPDAPDPAAPKRTFVHWVVYDIPNTVTSFAEGESPLARGAREGANDLGRGGWTGPCPPIGRHRYFFKLYALDSQLGDLGQPTKAELERIMADHVLERAELVGTYDRTGRGRR